MTDPTPLADAAWAAFADTLTQRIERHPQNGFVFVARAHGAAADGMRIHQTSSGWRLIGPRSFRHSEQRYVNQIDHTSVSAASMARYVIAITRGIWELAGPGEIADLGVDIVPGAESLPVRLDSDALRSRIRRDLASFVGGDPSIGDDLIIQIPGTGFATSIAVSTEEPRVDIFARVIADLPFDVSIPALARVLGPEQTITLTIDEGGLCASTHYPYDTYTSSYFYSLLGRWFAFVDGGLPVVRQALGLHNGTEGGPTRRRFPRPSLDLMAAQAWEAYVDELTAEIEALVPGQRLVIEQPVAYPEGPPGVVSVRAGSRGRCSATVHPAIATSAENSMSDRLGGLVDVGWLDRHGHMAIDDASDIEELARHIVDDALIATWDVVHPSFLSERRIVNEAGA